MYKKTLRNTHIFRHLTGVFLSLLLILSMALSPITAHAAICKSDPILNYTPSKSDSGLDANDSSAETTPQTTSNKSESASQIKLEKKEGSVTVTSSAGKNQSVRNGMRLYSGSHVKTGQKSTVWLSLDNTKAAKVDSNSDIEFRKRGNKLELMIHSGRIFFSVSEKLKNNETMNIKTSNATTGVRGTDGWADTDSTGLLTGKIKLTITDPVTGKVVVKWVEAGQSLSGLDGARKTPEKVDPSLLRATMINGAQMPAIVPEVLKERPEITERVKENQDKFTFNVDEVIAGAEEKRAEEDAEAAKREEQIADEIAQNQPETQEEKIPTFNEETVENPGTSSDTTGGSTGYSGGSSFEPTIYTGTCQLLIPKSMYYYMVLEGQEPPNDNNPNYNVYAVPAGTQIGYNLYFHEEFCTIPSSGLPTIGGAVATVAQETNGDWPLHFSGTLTVPNAQTATLTIGGYTSTTTPCNLTFPTEGVHINGISYKMDPSDSSEPIKYAISNDFGGSSVPVGATVTFSFDFRTGYTSANTVTATATPSTTLTRNPDGSNEYTFVASGDTAISFSGVVPSHNVYGVLSKSDPSLSAPDTLTLKRSLVPEDVDNETIFDLSAGTFALETKSGITTAVIAEELYPTGTISWFEGCEDLATITGLSNVDTSGVTDMDGLFSQCDVTSLNLAGWNTANVTNMMSMFNGCTALTTIYVSAPNVAAGTGFIVSETTTSESMFTDCTALVGGAGTTYNSANPITDSTYAHIDGGTSNPGYFTAAP